MSICFFSLNVVPLKGNIGIGSRGSCANGGANRKSILPIQARGFLLRLWGIGLEEGKGTGHGKVERSKMYIPKLPASGLQCVWHCSELDG